MAYGLGQLFLTSQCLSQSFIDFIALCAYVRFGKDLTNLKMNICNYLIGIILKYLIYIDLYIINLNSIYCFGSRLIF